MLSFISILACGPKAPSFTWPSAQINYRIALEYQGAFNPSGGAQPEMFQAFVLNLQCQAVPSEKSSTPMSCQMELSSPQSSNLFSGTLELVWKGHKLHKLDVPTEGTVYTDILYNALGALETPNVPAPCEDQVFETKTPQKLYRIPQLTGPSSSRSSHQISCSDNRILSQTELTVSAMAAENTSAPRFSFVGADELILAKDGLPQSRNTQLTLMSSSTALPPSSITQKIELTRQ
ncbi:MAG: hypothetical protein CMK59_12785 [Proteobacteria bacterium]|nr:hypothetical protein [Pseudomonadota bacterium]